MSQAAERQRQLPLKKAAQIAWKGIRVRLWRSILVTAGIVLPVAFLAYILVSDAFSSNVGERGSRALVQRLMAKGQLQQADAADARIQTRWMAGLALLISFVGILNAMLMSVTERFREIGTMKCLGALDAFIVRLFLLESLFQGAAGALAGILLGVLLAFGEAARQYGAEVWRVAPPRALLGAAGFCFAVGMALTVAGAIYPAVRAARMKPVDAMRTEI